MAYPMDPSFRGGQGYHRYTKNQEGEQAVPPSRLRKERGRPGRVGLRAEFAQARRANLPQIYGTHHFNGPKFASSRSVGSASTVLRQHMMVLRAPSVAPRVGIVVVCSPARSHPSTDLLDSVLSSLDLFEGLGDAPV
eukprot:scaffold37275_cov62-Phaeocystis_antarctica.AAC.2